MEHDKDDDATSPQDGEQEESTADELEKPSAEKDPDEEPKAPSTGEGDKDHHAVGIGVVDGSQTTADEE